MNNIVRLPPTDKWLGSCPNCGKPVWESYLIKENIYRCIECKYIMLKEAMIPF